jgi:hypothetical protein
MGRVPAIPTRTGAATDGQNTPGHDVPGTVPPNKVFCSPAAILMRMGTSPAMTWETVVMDDHCIGPPE